MSDNPYSEPGSNVVPPAPEEAVPGEARTRAMSHGWRWYRDAWAIFTPAWGQWLLTVLVLLAIMFGLQMVPMIGWLASSVVTPVLLAGLIYMADKACTGRGVELGDLFVGFSEKTGPLIVLGLINLGVTVVLMAIMMAAVMSGAGDLESLEHMSQGQIMQGQMPAGALMGVLVALALMIPWLAAYWFSVPLVFLGERSVGAALKESFFACFRNVLPFLWFGVLYMVFAMIATIPLGLGWLLLVPVLMLTYYASFRDIFIAD